jgi:hypothetical protein
MNSLRLADKVRIDRACYDSCVKCSLRMQSNKVLPVERQESSTLAVGEGEHSVVGPTLLGFARFRDSQNVVSEPSQLGDNGQREVFVGIQPCHPAPAASGRLVFGDLRIDLVAMESNVGPGIG